LWQIRMSTRKSPLLIHPRGPHIRPRGTSAGAGPSRWGLELGGKVALFSLLTIADLDSSPVRGWATRGSGFNQGVQVLLCRLGAWLGAMEPWWRESVYAQAAVRHGESCGRRFPLEKSVERGPRWSESRSGVQRASAKYGRRQTPGAKLFNRQGRRILADRCYIPPTALINKGMKPWPGPMIMPESNPFGPPRVLGIPPHPATRRARVETGPITPATVFWAPRRGAWSKEHSIWRLGISAGPQSLGFGGARYGVGEREQT